MLFKTQLENSEVFIFRCLQISTVFLFIGSCFQFLSTIKQWRKRETHATAIYIQTFFVVLHLCYGSIALVHTVMVLYQNNFTELNEYFTSFLLFVAYEGKFSPIIAVIDYSKRTSKPLKFGEDWKSALLIGIITGITVAISLAVSYCAIWLERNTGVILVFALIFAALMQIIGVVLTIHFYLKSKKLRFLSIDKCSLDEKHAISKNIFLLKFYIPIAIIESICGSLGIFAAVFSAMMGLSAVFVSAIFFIIYNFQIIFINIYVIFGGIFVLMQKRKIQQRRGRRNTKIGVVKTMLSAVPARGNIDDHFKNLNITVEPRYNAPRYNANLSILRFLCGPGKCLKEMT